MPCIRSQLVPFYPILHQWPEVAWLDLAPGRRAVPPELPAGGSRLPPWIPVWWHRSLPPTLHPHLGKGWTWHRHSPTGTLGRRGALPVAPVGSPALSHSWARCPQSPISPPSLCCSWDLPQGELRHSGPQNPWSWGSAAPMSHWLPRGLPCALLGTQPLSGATFSHQTMAREPGTTFPSSQSRCGQRQEHICSSVSQPVHFGSGTRSVLPNHICPVPECPRSPHGTSASSLAWLNGLELGAKEPRARLPSGAGQRHRWCHPPGLEHGPQPWGGASRLRGDALPAPQPLPAGAEPGVSARREGRDGLAGWAGCRQRVGGRWGAGRVEQGAGSV